MRESGRTLVEQLQITPDMQILDLGCGDGTTAIPAAQEGASVLGVDIATNLVAAGNQRAKDLGLHHCVFQEGDASSLTELADHSFDLVISIFGAMFAPRPAATAKEMVRVTKPGGRIVMGNWIPGDPTLVAQILKISSAYTAPPPEGFVSPMLWGVESHVTERFVDASIQKDRIHFQRDSFTFRSAASPIAFLNNFRDFYGPTMNAFEAARKNGRHEALQAELETLFTSQNKSNTPGSTDITATFLRVTVYC
jgi:SAM-dependent methyltransferase